MGCSAAEDAKSSEEGQVANRQTDILSWLDNFNNLCVREYEAHISGAAS